MNPSKTKRQSMGDALKRAPEVLAFLAEGKPRPAPERLEVVETKEKPTPVAAIAEVKEPEVKRVPERKAKVKRVQPEPAREAAGEGEEVPRTPVTFRLPSDLAERFVRASLTRKLAKKEPFSQQDIAAAALAAWLEKEGEA